MKPVVNPEPTPEMEPPAALAEVQTNAASNLSSDQPVAEVKPSAPSERETHAATDQHAPAPDHPDWTPSLSSPPPRWWLVAASALFFQTLAAYLNWMEWQLTIHASSWWCHVLTAGLVGLQAWLLAQHQRARIWVLALVAGVLLTLAVLSAGLMRDWDRPEARGTVSLVALLLLFGPAFGYTVCLPLFSSPSPAPMPSARQAATQSQEVSRQPQVPLYRPLFWFLLAVGACVLALIMLGLRWAVLPPTGSALASLFLLGWLFLISGPMFENIRFPSQTYSLNGVIVLLIVLVGYSLLDTGPRPPGIYVRGELLLLVLACFAITLAYPAPATPPGQDKPVA